MPHASYEPIAIVGRAVVLPGAVSPQALWAMVRDRQRVVEPVPFGRFGVDPTYVSGTPAKHLDRTWSTAGGYVDDDAAAAMLGDFPGRDDVKTLDPLFRWVLGSSYRALADAGFDAGLGEHRGGFVFGNLSYPTAAMAKLGETLAMPTSWRAALKREVGDLRDRQMSGLPALLARRHLGLDAFSFCLDAACASSLYAVHLAARALQERRADVVVAGAVNRADSLFLHVGFTALQALSTTGIPRPFDAMADGLVPAEGAVALSLMRLADATAQGRPIHGVILGSALSNDGRQKSLLAPSSEGQARAVAGAWQAAGIDPRHAGFFECHATGTQAGDRTEVETLASVVAEDADCIPLSSLKSNMGHLITAAGAAALVKVTEAMAHETLPPSIGVETPIKAIDGRRFRVQHEASQWAAPASGPRLAGVSAFGFGGNDAHVVVAAPAADRIYASASIEAPSVSAEDRALAVVACAVRSGGRRGGLELLLSEAELHSAHEVRVDIDGLKAPPNDLKCALGQQLLMLEAARDVVAHLGDDAPAALPSTRCGVMIGMGADMQVTAAGLRFRAEAYANAVGISADADVAALRDLAMAPMGPASVLGMMPNIPANRLNVQLDVRGPGFTVSSEQASGLDSVEAARALICAGDIDVAIVGAVEAGDDARHLSALGLKDDVGVDVAVAMVLMRPSRATSLGLDVLATLHPAGNGVDSVVGSGAIVVSAAGAAARGAQAAAGMVALGAAVAGASRAGAVVTVADHDGAERVAAVVAPAPRRRAERVAIGFGPVMSDSAPLSDRFIKIPAVAHALRQAFGSDDDVRAIVAGKRGAPGCERDLFVGASAMLARAAFVTDVLGVNAGHHIGVSLGESASLVAAGVWRDPRALLEDTVTSRLFVDEVAGARGAVEALWDSRGIPELERAWATAVIRAPRSQLEEAVASVEHASVTMWHTDDEAEVAGAPNDVIAVAAAVGATPVFLPDAPTVHGPAIAVVADRYRALHRRSCAPLPAGLTLWSCGAGQNGGVLDDVSADGCADAITRQASRTVDVPALLRAAVAAGVSTLIDVSPRGLLASWASRVVPELRVITIDGDPVAAARAVAAAGLTSSRHFMTSHIDEVHRAVAVPTHTPPKPWPAPPSPTAKAAATAGPDFMAPPPRRPRVSTVERVKTTPTAPAAAKPMMAPAPAPTRTPPSTPTPTTTTTSATPTPLTVTATTTMSAPQASADETALIEALRAQRAALATIHERFVNTAADAQQAFLAHRARMQQALLLDTPTEATTTTLAPALALRPAPATSAPSSTPVLAKASTTTTTPTTMPATTMPATTTTLAKTTSPVLFDRRALESLATDKISAVLGPVFARQDAFPRQVRMPEPPLLLCDRVLSTTATPGVLEKGRMMFTATDVRPDAWYLHEGRVPAGVLIETGQADLLLISMMGVDFENKGERCYRLLGCDLTYTAELPLVGQTLHHSITIDGFATAAISAASEARIFFFHSDTRLGDENGPIVLSVRNGQAGFFTDDELLHSGGVLWKPADDDARAIAAAPHAAPVTPTTKTSFTREELVAWSEGHAFACFGAGFELCQTHVRTPRIDSASIAADTFGNPDGRQIDMLLLDRVTQLDLQGGPWGRGYLRAELDLRADKWFYDGHFKDDPCMPGTVMFQGCLQAASVLLAGRGDIIDSDGFRFEPKHDAQMRLRCRGQATPSSRHMVYEVFVKSCSGGREPELHCDILVTVDGLKSLHCADVVLKLVADYPMTGRPDLMGVAPKTDGRDAVSPVSVLSESSKQPVLGFQSLMSTGVGRPGAAFPGLYDVYDDGSPVARMPGPPYHFMSHVDAVSGPPMGSLHQGKSAAGTSASVRYDVPADAWYFDEAQHSQGGTMPFAVLLEVALQPCGWLSSYAGSTRTSEAPLKYRNLDGKATQHREVGRDVGALITTATMTKSSSSGGMIIQDFSFETKTAAGEPVFSGTTVFGFFPQLALERQVGVGSSDDDKARLVAPSALPGFPMAFADAATWQRLEPSRLTLPAPVGAPPLLMIDRVEGAWRTDRGHLRVRTSKDVVLDDWFFKAHFFRDPVQPGSLGIEAMVQALQFAAAFDDVGKGMRQPRFEALATGAPLVWKYRGQVVPKNKLIQVEAEVTDVVRDERGVTVVGDGALWVDGLRIYLAKGLAIRVVEG